MQLKSKFFYELTTKELYEILKVRAEIFVVEQKCAYQDIDDKDYSSLHVFYENDGEVAAYLRAFPKEEHVVQVGRVLTLHHGNGLGGKLLHEGIAQIKKSFHPEKIYLEAQCHAIGFYKREGFSVCSDEFLEDGIPHVGMELLLEGGEQRDHSFIFDSVKNKLYESRIEEIFSWADVRGFVDWKHMGDLTDDVIDLLDDARKELSAPEDRWSLFTVACKIFLKWGTTDMDDDGDTVMAMDEVTGAWDDAVSRMKDEKEQKQALEFFMKSTDGTVIDYMEDYLYDFMDTHFRTPELLKIKRQFLEDKIKQEIKSDRCDDWKSIVISEFRLYLLQILSDEGADIEDVERYAETINTHDTRERLLRIYEERGEAEREIALLQEIAGEKKNIHGISYYYMRYEQKLKGLYKTTGQKEKYNALLKQMFYDYPDDADLYQEYRALFSDAEWKEEFEQNVVPVVSGYYRAMPLFEREKRYDLMMAEAEKDGRLDGYEKILKKHYPERCMPILIKNADELMDRARDRKGYRHVANVLEKIKGYPDGGAAAERLAEKYRQTYPRRTALWDELSRI